MALFHFSTLDPSRRLAALQRELERRLDNPLGFDLGVSGRGVFPAVNVFSDRDSYVIRLEVPGVAPEQIRIESHGRAISVSGTRVLPTPPGAGFHRRERDGGEFSRSIQLPDGLDGERAEAQCKNGVLTIRVPKRVEAQPRQILVKAA